MLKRFLSYYKPHKKVFALDMLASFFVSIIAVGYPIVTRNMLNDFIPNKRYSMIVLFGISLLVLYVIRMLLNYYIQYQGHMMGVSMLVQMRKDLFGHLEKLPFSYFDKNETG
ncbi:MAG: ABC transporter ATP-binding protein, partial [Clostridia bacterium]|nr:ABC transporter ATP-binding protein [Clostridia bacterium]